MTRQANPQSNVVAFRDLSFGYGDRRVIDRVSFEIQAGQVVALMGGSGVGKTTLLRLISGLVVPQQGHVEVFGAPLNPKNQQAPPL
jgi:phospholipid/cholesterol/gamma-HCH transport system ATP-binding protein